jgi:ABC-type transporter Mla subunit MlaD
MAPSIALPHISAPILYGCIFLVIIWLILLGLMVSSSQRLLKQIRRFSDALPEATDKGHSQNLGLAEPELDKLRERTRVLAGSAQSWWQIVFEHIQQYEDASGEERSFLTEQPRHILPSETLLTREFNSSLFSAFPGLLTGAGLTLTFVAILLALGGVHYNKLNAVEPVQGIEQLINGLSGKFLSSIVALTLSIIFTVCERSVQRTLRQRYEKLLFALVDSIPVLSTKRILLDIRKSSAEASVSVSHVSSEVTDRLAAALNERVVPSLSAAMINGISHALQQELSPTMDRMTGSLDSLQGAIVSLESQKQESVTGAFDRLAQRLETSLSEALSGMAESFHEGLSGSARQEFGNMKGTMEHTREVLADVSLQFAAMQDTFRAVVSRAEETTTGQLRAGREQTEALGTVMHQLMNELKESTQHNLTSVQKELAASVDAIVSKVGSLSAEMMSTANSVTAHAHQSSNEFLEKSEAVTASNIARMEQVLSTLEGRNRDFERAGNALSEARAYVTKLLGETGDGLGKMTEAGRQVSTLTAQMAAQTDAMRKVGEGHKQISSDLVAASTALQNGTAQQGEQLMQYQAKVEGFSGIIHNLDERIAAIMSATSEGLRDYNEKVRQNFEGILGVADKLIPEAAKRMQGQVEQFAELLESFNDQLDKSIGQLKTMNQSDARGRSNGRA